MWLRIFKPTPRRVFLFGLFLVASASGLLAIIPPFQQLFAFPYMLLSDYSAIIAQIIYSYIVACIYAGAYVWLEAGIRGRYPHMNDIVQKTKLPAPETVVTPSEPAPVHHKHPIRRAHAKVHAKIKHAVRRRR